MLRIDLRNMPDPVMHKGIDTTNAISPSLTTQSDMRHNGLDSPDKFMAKDMQSGKVTKTHALIFAQPEGQVRGLWPGSGQSSCCSWEDWSPPCKN